MIGGEEDLALIPTVVVLLPGLKAVGGAVGDDEVAVTPRGVDGGGVSNCGAGEGGIGRFAESSVAPSGAHAFGAINRWLTPPANFRWPSGPIAKIVATTFMKTL